MGWFCNRRRTYPPGPNVFSAIPGELFHRSDIALDDPVVDVADAQVLGIVDVADERLPGISWVCLSPTWQYLQ